MDTIKIKPVELDYTVKEAYKSLRTNLLFCGADIKVVTITSCNPGEGKTTTAFNLAQTIAEYGRKALFLDADLRGSIFAGTYRVSGAQWGESHYLSGQCKLDEVVYATDIKNLYTIMAGPFPPNPTELFGGKRFNEQISALRNAFDYIIIDTPPLGLVTDCAVISQQSDGIVMVLSSGAVKYKHAQSVKQQIEKTGCPLLGAVLNDVNISANGYYGKQYGKYYGKITSHRR